MGPRGSVGRAPHSPGTLLPAGQERSAAPGWAAPAQLLPDREGYPGGGQYFGPVTLPGNQAGETEESIW